MCPAVTDNMKAIWSAFRTCQKGSYYMGIKLFNCLPLGLKQLYKYVKWFKLRIVSSGMLRHVALVRTDVSEELSASFIRVTRIGELGTTLTVTSNRRMLQRNS
jgi:hypothetical protein